MSIHLTRFLATTDALEALFADQSALQAMLDVEAALARVEARLGLIPDEAAGVIGRSADAAAFDAADLARQARLSGTIVIPLVAALTAQVRTVDDRAAKFVHWGATSQDVADTALVLLVDRAVSRLEADHRALAAALRTLSDRHAGDVMLGRTLLQPAPPVTFGLKAAGWFAAVSRSWLRLETARGDAAIVQFGGASGTLAALGSRGLEVADELATELGLQPADAPWHPFRDRLAALLAACGIYGGVLGKMARDLSLLMQAEVAEVAEPGGGSSTLPNKRNPVGSAVALAAATRLPGLVSAALSALAQEHERGVGAWHAEWPVVTDILQTTGAALEAMRRTVTALSVDPSRMRHNIDATGGAALAERVVMLAGAVLGRDRAHAIVKDVAAASRTSGVPFARAIREHRELAAALKDADLQNIATPESYLGAAEALRQRLLATPGGS